MSSQASKTYSTLLTETAKQIMELEDRLQKNATSVSRLRNSLASNYIETVRAKEATEARVKLEGLKDYYEMRRNWGRFLKWCLGIILVFNISLVVAVGVGFLNFNDEWFLRIVLTT